MSLPAHNAFPSLPSVSSRDPARTHCASGHRRAFPWCALALLLPLCLLFPPFPCAAQNTRVRGCVRDAQTLEPIPYANVYFDGTAIGISTDADGRFSLDTPDKSATRLTASCLGYLPHTETVAPGTFSELNFALPPDPNQLDAVLVRPKDTYIKRILGQIDKARADNDPDAGEDWKASLYAKVEFDGTHMEPLLRPKAINKRLGFVLDYADTSAITGKAHIPILLSENLSDVYHIAAQGVNREIMRHNRISGLEEDNALRQFTGSYLLRANFYADHLSLFNLDLPNPIAASSHALYNHFLVDSLQVKGRKTYVLRFHPKKLVTSPTLDGEMHIDAEDFGIQSVHARLAVASNVNWIRHIQMDIENKRLDNGKWFHGEEKMLIDFSLSPSDSSKVLSFVARRHLVYGEPQFGPVTEEEALRSDDAVILSHATPLEDDAWAQARPVPLDTREEGIYEMVARVQDLPLYRWLYGISRALVTNYVEVKPARVEFGPWARTFVWNDLEGFRLQLGGRTLKELSQKVRIGGYIAYGFRDHDPKWELCTEWVLRRNKQRKLTLTLRKDFAQLGSGSGVFTTQNLFSSLLPAARKGFKESMALGGELLYEHEFSNDVNLSAAWTTRRLWASERVPLTRRDGSGSQESISMNELHTQLRFSREERVNHGVFLRNTMFTKYPIVTVDLYGGFSGILDDDFPYLRTEVSVEWDTPSHALGFGSVRLNYGALFGSVPYQLLKLHECNRNFFLDKDAFSCADPLDFASDRWVAGRYEHNFNGFFLGKLPLIKKLDLREVFSVRWAWGTLSEDNREFAPFALPDGSAQSLEIPYVELGVGISNILRVLRVDAFWRVTHRGEPNRRHFAVNIGLDLQF